MSWSKRIALALAILAVVGVLAGVGGIVGIFVWYGRGISEQNEARLRDYAPPQVTRIYSRDGTLIGEVYEQRRTLIPYDDVPARVENAFLAAEDADFYRHEGMDYMGMVRALLANIKARRVTQGASTITQQVVKIFMLSSERTLERKVQELILSRRLEKALTKQQILSLYLNEIYLGHGRYGIEEASRYYFGTSVREIDLGQAALLATLPKAPGRDSPYQNPVRAKTRQVWVLEQMVAHGFATQSDVQPFIDAPLDVITAAQRPSPVAGGEEFVDYAQRWLTETYGDAVPTLGASVTTTVDLKVQAEARAGLRTSLLELDARQGYGAQARVASPKLLRAARKDGAKPIVVGRTYRAVAVSSADVPLTADQYAATIGEHRVVVTVPAGARYRAEGKSVQAQFEPGVVHPVIVDAEADPAGWGRATVIVPESAVAISDPQTADVLAMVGGSAYARGQFNRVLQAARQPGSSFKPFVYGAAIASTQFTAATLVSDSPEIYEKWKPTNFLRDVYLGDVRLRVAMTKSINTIAIKLLDTVGFAAVHQFARDAGIDAELPEHLSLALGTAELKPIQMLAGYTTLARGGSRLAPRFILKVEAPGRNLSVPPVEPEQTLDAQAVYVLVSMMTSVVRSGTGAKANKIGRPAAGKTGTSADFHDAWFCGFTPDKVAVAWVGFDNPRYLGKGETGGKAAVPVWLAAMRAAVSGEPVPFVPPEGIVVQRIDAASGLRAVASGGDERETLDEVFMAGTEPVDFAVPAALPKGDVLLDLYGDASATNTAEHDPDALLAPEAELDYDGDADYDPGRARPDEGGGSRGGLGGTPADPIPPRGTLPSLADAP